MPLCRAKRGCPFETIALNIPLVGETSGLTIPAGLADHRVQSIPSLNHSYYN